VTGTPATDAWRLLAALAASRYEDITGEDCRIWDNLNQVLDGHAAPHEVRPLTAALAVDLGSLTDRASRRILTGLTEETRLAACVLLHEVQPRLRNGLLDIGLLRRLALMAEKVLCEVLAPAPPRPASSSTSARAAVHFPVPARQTGQWSRNSALATYPGASE
jgi:hypothetical protein